MPQITNRITDLQDPIAFSDLADRENLERDRLQGRLLQLTDAANKRALTTAEQTERREVEQKLALDDVVDPLFKGIQKKLTPKVGDHKQGLLPSQQMVDALRILATGVPKHSGPDWSLLVELAGLDSFDSNGELARSIKSLAETGITKSASMLKAVDVLFEKYVAGLGAGADPTAAKQQQDKAREKLAKDVEAIANTRGHFTDVLAKAIRQDLIAPSESLIDWMLAVVDVAALPRTAVIGPLTSDEKMLTAVAGLLQVDQVDPPDYHLPQFAVLGSVDDLRRGQTFGKALFGAQGEYVTNLDLYNAVLPILVTAGDQGPIDAVSGKEWASVVRYLMKKGVTASEAQLTRRVDEALNSIQNIGDDLAPSLQGIDLPDLEQETTDFEIVGDNIRALQPAYFAAMFEELKVFQVVDKLVELFQNGVLPIGRGDAGNNLFRYWKETALRVSEGERRSFYARTLGVPGGDDNGMPNREFNDLWMRFVSAVSSFIRQNNVDDLLRSRIPGAISQQAVRKAGRDLAANLSLHGYGMAYFMATELQKHVKDVIKLLSDPDIRNAYGSRDMWQVIDQVATLELGGAKNSVRYRTMAASGAIIIAWLAQHARALSSTSFGPILDITQIQNPSPRARGSKATTDPTDFDLVNACEQWLAVTGTQDEMVEDYAQPKEAPMMTAKPIQIPAVARDLLESVGVPSMGLSAGGNGYTRR